MDEKSKDTMAEPYQEKSRKVQYWGQQRSCAELSGSQASGRGPELDESEKADNLVPSNMETWSRDEVKEWPLNLQGVDQNSAEILFNQDITGESLKHLDTTDLTKMDVNFGPAYFINLAKNEMIKDKEKQCIPYPFGKYAAAHWYIEGDILNVVESGPSDLIEPCHEFKAFTNTTNTDKFVEKVIRFAASCMNSRTNGTIHFGIIDKPHGKVQGVPVDSRVKEEYDQKLRLAIKKHFCSEHKDVAQNCIKPPRFVEVRKRNLPTNKFVIEVDIVPHNTLCKSELFHTSNATTKEKQFFIRDGGSCRNLLAKTTEDKKYKDYQRFVSNVDTLSNLRKQLEEKHLSVVKGHMQGSKLCQMITGGTGSLDKSYYKHYVIVTNHSVPSLLDSMRFLIDLKPATFFYMDHFKQIEDQCKHREKYSQEIAVPEECKSLIAEEDTSLHAIRSPIYPGNLSHINHWIDDQMAIQTAIPLCQNEVFQNPKFLVVFLILSEVDEMDTLLETFCTFYQKLKSTKQILCICGNENAFISWKNLINAHCEVDISSRCIYELSFAEVNGTILSLLSENRRSSRFLPGAEGSRVLLEKKVEHKLTTLDVLCVNQCDGGNKDQVSVKQNFYREREMSWMNFCEQRGSMPFIKRDKFVYITDTLIPDLCSLTKACVLFNLQHVPKCGGTTLAKYTLWTLREKFRSAVLIDNNADIGTVAGHVITLLQYGSKEQEPLVPVLLMIDNFQDMKKVLYLQQDIEKRCLSSSVQSRSPQVILLNCMRSEHISGPTDPTEHTIFIEENIFEDQQAKGNRFLCHERGLSTICCCSLLFSSAKKVFACLFRHLDSPAATI